MTADPSARSEHPDFTVLHAFIWMLGAFLLTLGCVLLMVSGDSDRAQDLVTLGAVSSTAFLGVTGFLLSKYPGGSRLSTAVGARATQPLLVFIGFLLGLVAQVPADRIRQLVDAAFPVPEAEAAARASLLQAHSPSHAVALFIVAALLVPVAEETFFRGAVFGALRRSGRSATLAALVTSLGFTLSHDVRYWLPIAFIAALLGLLRAASGSLLPGLALHIGFNGLTMLASVADWGDRVAGEVSLRVELAAWALVSFLALGAAALARSRAATGARRAEGPHR